MKKLQTREVIDPKTGKPGFVFWLGADGEQPPTREVPDPAPSHAAWVPVWLMLGALALGVALGYFLRR